MASHQFASFEFALCFRPRAATEKHGPVTTRDAVGAHLNECALVAVSLGPALVTSRLPISYSHMGGNAKVFIDGFFIAREAERVKHRRQVLQIVLNQC